MTPPCVAAASVGRVVSGIFMDSLCGVVVFRCSKWSRRLNVWGHGGWVSLVVGRGDVLLDHGWVSSLWTIVGFASLISQQEHAYRV